MNYAPVRVDLAKEAASELAFMETKLQDLNKRSFTQAGEPVVFQYYAVESQERFGRMTPDDARSFGRLEFRAISKNWKHRGGAHHVRARMEFEDMLRRFGLRELRVKDGEIIRR